MLQQEKEFKCIGKNCNLCCRDPLTPIELTLGDISRIVNFTNMPPNDFIDRYVEFNYWTLDSRRGIYTYQPSLVSPCNLWDNGCTVYNSRPIFCSLFPYIIIKNKKRPKKDLFEGFRQYYDFPCMKEASKLSDDQLNFLKKVKPIAKREEDISLGLLKEYGLCIIKKFDDLPELISSKEYKKTQKLASKYLKEEKRKEFYDALELLSKIQDKVIKNHIIDDFGFDPKDKLKEIFSEENLEYLFEPTSKYYLNLLSTYDNNL